jgi:hypothetical protein
MKRVMPAGAFAATGYPLHVKIIWLQAILVCIISHTCMRLQLGSCTGNT